MNETANVLKAGSRVGIVWGVIVVILGILAMLAPLASGIAITLLVGIVLLASGLVQSIYAFRSDTALTGIGSLLFGGLTALAGLILVVHPGEGLKMITLFLGIYFLADGAVSLIQGLRFRPFPGWGSMVFSGIISLLLGGIILVGWPLSGIWAVGILVGVRLLFAGWTMIFLGTAAGEIAEQMKG